MHPLKLKCPACGSSAFHVATLKSHGDGYPVKVGRSAEVHAAVCLACGVITAHVDEYSLQRLRTEHAEGRPSEPVARTIIFPTTGRPLLESTAIGMGTGSGFVLTRRYRRPRLQGGQAVLHLVHRRHPQRQHTGGLLPQHHAALRMDARQGPRPARDQELSRISLAGRAGGRARHADRQTAPGQLANALRLADNWASARGQPRRRRAARQGCHQKGKNAGGRSRPGPRAARQHAANDRRSRKKASRTTAGPA
jgi:hypothetical protein